MYKKIITALLLFQTLIGITTINAQQQTDSLKIDTMSIDMVVSDTLIADTLETDTIASITVQERIEKLLKDDMFNTSQLGLMAYDLDSDTIIYAFNARQTMRPASTMKLLTAITALDRLGSDYRYSTTLKSKGSLYDNVNLITEDDDKDKRRRVFVGNIIVVGGMDPRFNSDDMNAFVEALRKERIDTIYGDVQADRSFKDSDMLGEGWCWDDKNPVLTPLLWNRKDYFISKFRESLNDAGIAVLPMLQMPKDSLGFSIYPPATERAVTLCTRHHTLDQILVKMMKDSDNLYAESMFYQIAAKQGNRPATAKQAAAVMKQLIKKIGFNPSRYRIADGSGLSLYNYQSAELQIALLRYAYQNPNIYGHLYPSLPIAGRDGTLKSRMRKTPAEGNVHAKTGTLSGISSLSGYLTAASSHTLCFAIINQGVMHASNAKAFQNKVCNILCGYGKGTDGAKVKENPSE